MHTALLIVDMQNDFVLEDAAARVAGALGSVPRVVELLAAARALGCMVVHVVREYHADASNVELPRRQAFLAAGGYAVPGTAGAQIIEPLTPAAGEHRLVKPRFSAFLHTPLHSLLRQNAVSRVVVCGTQYPNCIRATAFDALSFDYDVIVAQDATSAQTPEIAQANIVDLRNVGIACMPVDEVLALLSAVA